jgi:diguanylate cyclase (GGDEF)-like protein/PAS domain S-box-containing protein
MLAISYLVSLLQPLRTAAFRLVLAVPVYLVAATISGADDVSPVKPAPTTGTPDWTILALSLGLIAALLLLHRLRRRLEVSEKNLARSESEWVQALDFAEDAMCLIDLNDHLIRANQAFYRFVGYTPEEAIGKKVRSLIHGGPEKNPCPVCQARLECRNGVFVKEAYDPMNRFRKPFEVIVRVIRDPQGDPIGIFQMLRDLSRQRNAEDAMRESERRHRGLSQAAFDGIAIHDKGVIVNLNPALAAMLGYTDSELMGAHLLEFVAEPSRAIVTEWLLAKSDDSMEIQTIRKDGTIRTVEVRACDFPYQGRALRVVAVRDIRELKRAQQALLEEKERLMVTLKSIGEAVIVTDVEGRVQDMNPVAENLLGCSEAQARGEKLPDLCRIVDEARGLAPLDLARSCLKQNIIINSKSNCVLTRHDGHEFVIEYSTGPIRSGDGMVSGVVLALRDVSEMRQLEQQLIYQARHDTLTGLMNRHQFEQRLETALESARANKNQHVLCYFDLDQFKVVNDTCGHVAGDQMLAQIAALISPKVRNSDTVARLGGDEFGVLLEDCPRSMAFEIAEMLRQVVADFRFVWGDRTFDVGVSIGMATMTADSASVAEVMIAADAACYVAKDLGRNRIHMHQPDDAALVRHRGEIEWSQRVSSALKENRLRLYSQPIIALHPGDSPVWDEILVYMVDQEGQAVPPMAFIPAAERYNLMPVVDRWVVTHSLAWLQRARRVAAPRACSINLSGRSLCESKFLEYVIAEIRRFGVDPASITFEITETAAVANFAQAQQFIIALKRMGCRFALDDFGSGLSSFAYLKHLPVDYLKIDGNFVRDMANDQIDHAMVEAINQLGHVMGIQTIAEYVETREVLEKLRTIGVDYAQGFALGYPVPIDEALAAAGIVLTADNAGR